MGTASNIPDTSQIEQRMQTLRRVMTTKAAIAQTPKNSGLDP